VNDRLAHGNPRHRKWCCVRGDLVNIDVFSRAGWLTGQILEPASRLERVSAQGAPRVAGLRHTASRLEDGLSQARAGAPVAQIIGRAVERSSEAVRFPGHSQSLRATAVGRFIHEDPQVFRIHFTDTTERYCEKGS